MTQGTQQFLDESRVDIIFVCKMVNKTKIPFYIGLELGKMIFMLTTLRSLKLLIVCRKDVTYTQPDEIPQNDLTYIILLLLIFSLICTMHLTDLGQKNNCS